MIKMNVGAIALGRNGDPILLLSDESNKVALPIWIGASEARAITLAANKVESARPLTHDVLHSVIKHLGYDVKEILIDELSRDTFKALIVLSRASADNGGPQILQIDARPSDAIALAMLADAPVFVSPKIIEMASISVTFELEEQQDEQTFKDFLKDVKASDFNFIGMGPVEPLEDDDDLEG